MTEPSDRDVVIDVPVHFDVAGGPRIHSPMVHAVVGGVATRLILDTGATDHVLTRTLIDAAGLPVAPTEDGTDHAGAPVPSWSVGELDVSIGGHGFGLRDVVAIASPVPFDDWGVGGFLSPQHLHPDARILIDLAGDRLVVARLDGNGPTAVDAVLATRVPDLRPLRLDRDAGEPTVVARAAIEGLTAIPTMWNTGGRHTEIARSVVPGLAGSSVRAGSTGISGAGVFGAEAGPRTLVVGDARVPVTALIVREEMEPPLGLIGMDVLRGTALIVGAGRDAPFLWLVPPAWFPG
jgi:hypothetical protein